MTKDKNSTKAKIKNKSENEFTNSYLPNMRTDYHPKDKSVESGTGVDFPINMPNPAKDDIVVNNIASQEFDYTQELFTNENNPMDK